MVDKCSHTSFAFHLFKASLLCFALLSTFYLHCSSPLRLFLVLVVSSFLFFNIVSTYQKMTSYEILPQAKNGLKNEVIEQKGLQNEDGHPHDLTLLRAVSYCPNKKNSYSFTTDNVSEPDLTSYSLSEKNEKDLTSIEKSELAPISFGTSASSLHDYESISEDSDEDYLIEIPLPEQVAAPEEGKTHKLEAELLNLASDYVVQRDSVEEFPPDDGEENLIEIDISIGSIRHSGCEITI